MTESRIKTNSDSPINTELENYSTEHTPAKITGGALFTSTKGYPIIEEMI